MIKYVVIAIIALALPSAAFADQSHGHAPPRCEHGQNPAYC